MNRMDVPTVDRERLDARPVLEGKGDLCRDILGDLPEWFSEAEGVEACAKIVEDLPMLAVTLDGTVAGIVALKVHAPDAMEIFVLATRRGQHRRGIGRRLVAAAGRFALEAGCRLLTVKTLAPRGRPEPQFEATRAFYSRSGFFRAETFPTLWHADHPCLFLVKPL